MNHLQDFIRLLLLSAAMVCFTAPEAASQTQASKTSARASASGASVSAPASFTGLDINAASTAAVQIVTPRSTGSGSLHILEDLALVITNRHVVMGHDEIEVHTLHDIFEPARPTYIAALSYYSMEYDFAVYQIVRDMSGNRVSTDQVRRGTHRNGLALQPLTSVETDTPLNRGDRISILSFPGIGDNELVYSQGIISSLKFEEYEGQRLPEFIRTNAEFSPGSSGGIALNSDGLFIGIPTYVRTEEQTGARLGSILSIHMIAAVSEAGNYHTSWNDLYTDVAVQHGLAPRINGEPYFGSHRLRAGFTPDPYQIGITAGGDIDISYLGGDCVGHISQNPDAQLHWSGSSPYLTFKFLPDQQGDDTTLIINAPDGSWYCNDDAHSNTLDPALTFFNPDEGRFDIWVGTFHDGPLISGQLHITELEMAGTDPFAAEAEQGFELNPTRLRFQTRPTAANLRLTTGFTPDPHTLEATAGGPVSLEEETNYLCAGYAGEAPAVRFDWSGEAHTLQFFFRAHDDSDDATMLIRDPDGLYHCNDDVFPGNLNPGLNFSNPMEGRYHIWLGTFREGERARGQLEISEGYIEEFYFHDDFEDDFYYDEPHTGSGLNWTTDPHFGTINLREGFTPDPHSVQITAGGSNSVRALNLGSGCTGFAATAPDLRLHWSGDTGLLNIFFEANNPGDDTTLIINAPDGSWHCNDDAHSGTLNPQLHFSNPASGQYDIWVGTFHQGESITGMLHISELRSQNPR